MKTDKLILFISVIIFVGLVVLSFFLSKNITLSINLIFIGIIVLTVPYSVYRFFQFKKIRSYERDLPKFLRDIAEAQRAGLTLVQAIRASAKSEYGVLTNEIRKIEKQLSWNVPLEKVLKKFTERMSDSKIIVRSFMLIDQANKSGGNVEDAMDSLATQIESLRDVQEEKSAMLNQQVVMMYAIFFIFMGITMSLIKFLIPLLQTQGLSGGGLGLQSFNANPCHTCINNPDPGCFGCASFFTISSSLDFGKPEDPASYYKALFFIMILIQGFFSGLIAGQISSDSIVEGVKHSLIMLFAGFVVFVLVIKLGLI
ncbi:MAG: type II secretion system F family protein [Candidatus Aenigmarchaeota archaeon]|nr:type II secretion system F family protein [Candidatus Aenigmarchaeota archaeon]